MLRDGDLKAFLAAFRKSDDPQLWPASPADVLTKDDGLFAAEVWRLRCSLQIAAVLGDAPQAAAVVAQIILDEMRDLRCAPIEDEDAWIGAIAWARAQPALVHLDAPHGHEREAIVGAACLRLRKRGYKVEVGAYGPLIAEASRRQIVGSADALVQRLGGLETAAQVLRCLRDADRYYDGMWLFGVTGLGTYDAKRPMIPMGWLLSLALRHIGLPSKARKPEVAWKSLVSLATDFAAAHDCQHYNQFEHINIHASQFSRALADSTLWRELFTLPQVPPKALHHILDSLATALLRDDQERLGFSFRTLDREIRQLVEWSAGDRMTIFPREQVEQALPTLQRLTGGAVQSVNVDYGDPLAAGRRTQDSALLLACGPLHAATMPRAFLAAAVCEYVFRQVWSKLNARRAEQVVKETLERAIERGCEGKAPMILPRQKYKVGGHTYEFDVATRDEDRIVLIETKAKSLTQRSRSGNILTFLKDYEGSFLAMMAQLVRHEARLKRGQTPLTVVGEAVEDLRPVKVAVSPLSYGPVSDKLLSGSVLRSLVGARLKLVAPASVNQKVIDAFNKSVEGVIADMVLVAPKKDGLPDLFSYLIDIFWLDLGQLLYVLDRADTVWSAFQPLSYITFSSRDFWTDLATADRGGLAQGRWRPPS